MAEDETTGRQLEPPERTWIANAIAEFHLPAVIAGPAGAAISRLIGGAVDIPAAWLDAKAQAIKDRTQAKTAVNKAVTAHAIKAIEADPDLHRRAAESLIAREYRAQINKEAVAHKTLDYLSASSKQDSTDRRNGPDPAEPPPDWMNAFERLAADASSSRLQDMWARILAGEIERPSSFSLQTLRVIAELDQEAAQAFDRVSEHVIGGRHLPVMEPPLILRSDAQLLDDAGLITGTSGFASSLEFKGNTALEYGDHAILVLQNKSFSLTVFPLTKAGRELFRIVDRKADYSDSARIFAERLPKGPGITQILFGRVEGVELLTNEITVRPEITLWTLSPNESAPPPP